MYSVRDDVANNKPCPNIKGTTTRWLWAHPSDLDPVAAFPWPDICTAADHAAAINSPAGDITFQATKGFSMLDINTQSGEVKSALVGEPGDGSFQNSVGGEAAPSADLLGFLNGYAAQELIWLIEEGVGRYRQVGHPTLPAHFTASETTSGKKQEDKRFTSVELMSYGLIAPIYSGTITLKA